MAKKATNTTTKEQVTNAQLATAATKTATKAAVESATVPTWLEAAGGEKGVECSATIYNKLPSRKAATAMGVNFLYESKSGLVSYNYQTAKILGASSDIAALRNALQAMVSLVLKDMYYKARGINSRSKVRTTAPLGVVINFPSSPSASFDFAKALKSVRFVSKEEGALYAGSIDENGKFCPPACSKTALKKFVSTRANEILTRLLDCNVIQK